MRITLILLSGVLACCATVRPITYPSPCVDRGDAIQCKVTGYEVWGDREQVESVAKKCPKSAHVSVDPHGDYGVVRCYSPDTKAEAVSVVVVEKSPAVVDPPREIKQVDAPVLHTNDVSTWRPTKDNAKKRVKRKGSR